MAQQKFSELRFPNSPVAINLHLLEPLVFRQKIPPPVDRAPIGAAAPGHLFQGQRHSKWRAASVRVFFGLPGVGTTKLCQICQIFWL